jgi:Fe-S-cluster containining protein
MAIVTDLNYIRKMAGRRDRENVRFRTFLKGHDLGWDGIDEIVHEIYEEVVAQIDCTQCANCCIELNTVVDEDDINRLARGLKMSAAEFKEQFVILDRDMPYKWLINGLPCPFLKDKRCTLYEYRPEECRSYPNLHKEDFVSRLFSVIDNYAFCPIVFNVYEQLKSELQFTQR